MPIGFPGPIQIYAFRLNMYTSPALLSTLIYLSSALLLFLYFNEYAVLDNETQDLTKILEGTYGQSIRNILI